MVLSSLIGRMISWLEHWETKSIPITRKHWALSGSQVWPLGPFNKFGRPRDVLRVFSKAFLNCVSPFSCVPDWSVIYTGADRFGDIWVPRRSFRFHYRLSREHQGSPSPSLIKVLVLWKLYIRRCWIRTFCPCGWKLCLSLSLCMDICVSVVMYVWIRYIISVYICCWRYVSHEICVLLVW